jgi:hypothetical protein
MSSNWQNREPSLRSEPSDRASGGAGEVAV